MRTSTDRLQLALALGIPFLLAALLYVRGADGQVETAIDDLLELAAPLAAGAACILAAARSEAAAEHKESASTADDTPADRTVSYGWRALAAACVAWAVGQALWTHY